MLDLWLDYKDLWLSGLKVTASLTLLAILLGFVLALPIGVARARNRGLSGVLAYGYVNFFRGMPLLVLLFLVYYGAGEFSRDLRSLGLWWFFRDAYYCGLLALVLNTAAYQAEIIRGSLNGIPSSIREANAALNLTRWTAFRRVLFPIAIARALPGLGNEFILLLKATSLLAIITIFDLMGQARFIFSETFDLRAYYVAALHYLVLVLVLEWFLRRIESRNAWAA
ncbi:MULTISPECIES: ABC transporter permease subunit [Pseudophaeobacter]|mgnify:CR=1 FL=1|jgi:polar amino acid transport system permease protein|uniref:ABC transporter permease subunit n=1 Tax=Pseudophaeobacter TaxID=1541822 RepID=UPI00242B3EC6|nr:ABC transporter permease subunit [Pseudophaeobacter profundi]